MTMSKHAVDIIEFRLAERLRSFPFGHMVTGITYNGECHYHNLIAVQIKETYGYFIIIRELHTGKEYHRPIATNNLDTVAQVLVQVFNIVDIILPTTTVEPTTLDNMVW